MQFVMEMDIEDFLKLIAKALEKQREQKAWEMWMALYPSMIIPQPLQKEPFIEFVSFGKFYERMKTPVKQETAQEILAKVEEIRKLVRPSKG